MADPKTLFFYYSVNKSYLFVGVISRFYKEITTKQMILQSTNCQQFDNNFQRESLSKSNEENLVNDKLESKLLCYLCRRCNELT